MKRFGRILLMLLAITIVFLCGVSLGGYCVWYHGQSILLSWQEAYLDVSTNYINKQNQTSLNEWTHHRDYNDLLDKYNDLLDEYKEVEKTNQALLEKNEALRAEIKGYMQIINPDWIIY